MKAVLKIANLMSVVACLTVMALGVKQTQLSATGDVGGQATAQTHETTGAW